MTATILERLLRISVYKAGYPTANETLARNYFMVVYDVGPDGGFTTFKMGLN